MTFAGSFYGFSGAFVSFFSDGFVSVGFVSGDFTSVFGSEAGVSFFSSFFFVGAGDAALLSVLYHPLPLKCTAGGAINFSVLLLPHAGHDGSSLLPNGRECSKMWSHFLHWKSKVGISPVYKISSIDEPRLLQYPAAREHCRHANGGICRNRSDRESRRHLQCKSLLGRLYGMKTVDHQ